LANITITKFDHALTALDFELSSACPEALKRYRSGGEQTVRVEHVTVEDQPDNRQIIRDMLAGTDY